MRKVAELQSNIQMIYNKNKMRTTSDKLYGVYFYWQIIDKTLKRIKTRKEKSNC